MARNNGMPIQKSNPTVRSVHVNTPLTNISVAFIQENDVFIASKVFPTVPVNKKSDKYFTYDQADFNRGIANKRAAGTESQGVGYSVSTDSYDCETYALHHDITDDARDNEDSPLDSDRDATQMLTQNMMISRERDFVDSFMTDSIWGEDFTPDTLWTVAGSTPIDDIKQAGRRIQQRTGMMRSKLKLIVTPDVDDTLTEHAQVIDRVKYTSGQTVNSKTLAMLFNIGSYEVIEAIGDLAKEGLTKDMQFVGGSGNALLVYVNPTPSLKMPSGGYTFSWKKRNGGTAAPQVKKFRMEHLESDRIETAMNYDMKVVSADCGIFFKDVLTTP